MGELREQVDQATRTASVQLTVQGGVDKTLLPGASVQVELEGKPHDAYPIVPKAAVRNNQVFTVVEERLVRKSVVVAFREANSVAIESGLKEGELLVISDPGLAMDGTLVRINTHEP